MHENQITSTNTTFRIGASTLRFESPSTCAVEYVGILDVDVIEQMNKALMDTSRRIHPLFLIVDLSRTGTVTQLGRRQGAGGMLALNPAATAVIVASFHMRVVVEMITKAAKLLNAGLKGPVELFANEKDARAWITQLQKESRALK
jgi:hypothetical protein